MLYILCIEFVAIDIERCGSLQRKHMAYLNRKTKRARFTIAEGIENTF